MKITKNKEAIDYFKSVNLSLGMENDLELLKTSFGISEFGYLKIFFDNRYIYLSSDPEMISLSVKKDKRFTSFCDKILPSHKGYSLTLWPKLPTHPSMKLYAEHNHWNGISFYKMLEDGIELYWFTSEIHNASANNFYLHNSRILIAFLEYWNSKSKQISSLSRPKKLASYMYDVDFSNLQEITLISDAEKDQEKAFLELIRSKGTSIRTQTGDIHLTARESECLSLLSQCNTTKEVANSLNISSRTVEGHVNNIRSKAGLLYKSDLVKLYREQIIDLEL